MQEIDINSLTQQVLWSGFALAFVFGALAQRTHFCTMGAIADIVNMGDWARMRMWVLAIAVAILGFNTMVYLGWVEAGKSIYAAPRLLWLSYIVGGLMFGFGMVLASGCGNKTLVRIGAGNLKSLVVFVVMGVAAFATLRGITAVARVNTVDTVALALPSGQDLPSLLAGALGQSPRQAALVLGLLLGGALLAWVLARAEGRRGEVLVGGLGSGLVIVGIWWVSGVLGHVAEHPETLEETFLGGSAPQRMEALSFVAPFAGTLDWLMFFSDKSKVLTLGVVAVLGVIAGSAVCALATRSFRWEAFRGVEDTANHLVGAVLMGVGGVVAMGCTVGQGLSGVSTLSLGSFIALAAIVAGAVLALRYQVWRLERMV
ncbi:MAG: YeeE/YedE family protein [Roseateles asaccharophilus]|uniref:Uncharacterized protein n=1 Tax=Roseateles asaccharophilus TaxID=582607 RepID=A0A4R6N8W9_9BURK|nr:YeeE/YedE family protein [Roseateles asaccharophilus]MDN3543794.1 YeeE/YedE family protein [Roseateles asaccharophilus]TDP11828.1 hypothetical protein DFR39_102208 [Roseateles asaccharophilus]